MEYKRINGIKIPALGLGTWHMGGTIVANHSNDAEYIEAIKRAIDSGITHIDTAEMYGHGHAEELVSKAIEGYDRKKLFITTKVSPNHLLTKKQVINAAKNSLKRLKTDYIDLYLVHWLPPILYHKSLRNAMSAFDQLIEEGLVRYIGVSNFSVKQMREAQGLTKNKIITNQVEYSLLNREPEMELLDFCVKEKVILTAYTPIAKGKLSTNNFKVLDEIAKKYKKTAIQVSLRYLLDKENVIAIPKMTSEAHLKEVLGSLGWRLKKEDQEILKNAF